MQRVPGRYHLDGNRAFILLVVLHTNCKIIMKMQGFLVLSSKVIEMITYRVSGPKNQCIHFRIIQNDCLRINFPLKIYEHWICEQWKMSLRCSIIGIHFFNSELIGAIQAIGFAIVSWAWLENFVQNWRFQLILNSEYFILPA